MIPTDIQLAVLKSVSINAALSAAYNFVAEDGPSTVSDAFAKQIDEITLYWPLEKLVHYMFPGTLSDGHLYYMSEQRMRDLIRPEYADDFKNFLLEVAMSRA